MFTARAFGPAIGAVVGWFYFWAAAVAQALVTLTGAHYAADALGWGRLATYTLATSMLTAAVASNLRGLRLSARLQLALAGGVALILLTTTVAAIPHEHIRHLSPFFARGWTATARSAVLLFFAFFGWEAITHLSAEFRDPTRDVPRATLISVVTASVSAPATGRRTDSRGGSDRAAAAARSRARSAPVNA